MDYLELMFAGFAVFWAAIFAYLLWLQMRVRSLRTEIERLEERLSEQEGAPTARAAGAPHNA
jgi:CcmD family protein